MNHDTPVLQTRIRAVKAAYIEFDEAQHLRQCAVRYQSTEKLLTALLRSGLLACRPSGMGKSIPSVNATALNILFRELS